MREKRTELAQKRAVPAYIIFGDKALRDIAAKKPVTKEAFSSIYGVGENKLKSYADIFIKVVNDFGLNHSHYSLLAGSPHSTRIKVGNRGQGVRRMRKESTT